MIAGCRPRTRGPECSITVFSMAKKFRNMIVGTYLVGGEIRTECAVGNFVISETPFKSETAMSPLFVLPLVDVRHQVFGVHVEVPVDHIKASIIPFFVVSS